MTVINMMISSLTILKALSDETRFNIIKLLLNGERCVCEIHPNVNVTQSTTSTHLNKLEEAGIIKSRRDGKKVFYHISDKRVIKILQALGDKNKIKTKVKCHCD
ncbi:MAG: metalloregulator ArsR/SmtB family transcription factor [Candidatus Nanoarchaeia archaeon]